MPYRIENYIKDLNKPICKQLIHYYDYCVFERNFTQQTMIGKTSSINHFVRFSNIDRLEEISNELVSEYIKTQTIQEIKPRTINNRVKHLLAMIRYYQDEEDMVFPLLQERKIHKQHEAPANKRAFSRETIYKALRYADREQWLMIKICFDCGLRISELRKMRLRDINGDSLLVHGKGRKDRPAILSEEVVIRLKDWIEREGIVDYVWPSKAKTHRGQPKSDATVRRMIRAPFTAAGVPQVCPHELRVSYATDLTFLGAETRSIQQGLGHASERTTEIYLKDTLTQKRLKPLYNLKYSASAPELR